MHNKHLFQNNEIEFMFQQPSENTYIITEQKNLIYMHIAWLFLSTVFDCCHPGMPSFSVTSHLFPMEYPNISTLILSV